MKLSTFLPLGLSPLLGLILASAGLLSACSYTQLAEPVTSCPSLPTTISYKNNVLPILRNDCYRCHNAQSYKTSALGALNMEDFNDLKYWSTPANGMNGQSWLVGNMRHDPGFKPMPYDGVGGPDACDIALIKAWVDAGAPNN